MEGSEVWNYELLNSLQLVFFQFNNEVNCELNSSLKVHLTLARELSSFSPALTKLFSTFLLSGFSFFPRLKSRCNTEKNIFSFGDWTSRKLVVKIVLILRAVREFKQSKWNIFLIFIIIKEVRCVNIYKSI